MITNEEIVQKLTDYRKEKAPQVNDRWIKEKATELMLLVTEETVLDDLLKVPFKELEITQKAINSAFAAEAKRLKDLEAQNPPANPPANPPKTEDKTDLPKEVLDFMANYKSDQAKKALEDKRNSIYGSLEPKVNESQRKVLRKIVDLHPLTIDDLDDDISDKVMVTFTEFQKGLAGDTNPAAPRGETKNEDLKKSFEEKIKRYNIV